MACTFSGQVRICSLSVTTASDHRTPGSGGLEWIQKGLPLGVRKASRDPSSNSDHEFARALPVLSSPVPMLEVPASRSFHLKRERMV